MYICINLRQIKFKLVLLQSITKFRIDDVSSVKVAYKYISYRPVVASTILNLLKEFILNRKKNIIIALNINL